MRILSSIISNIWNTVTFMDKEQRALVAHVLAVSQAHPKSFAFRNGAWFSDGMKVTYTQAQKNVNLSGVFYELGWRANAILAKHFAMLHICLHREHIGKALSDIDKSENCIKTDDVIKPVDNFKKVDLANYFGSHVAITMRDGTEHIGEVGKNQHDRYSIIDCFIPSHHYLEDIVKIEYTDGKLAGSQWITDIDLAQWVGKTVDVKLRNGTIVDAVDVNHRARKTLYQVKVEHVSYTRCGKFWHDRLDGRDIMAIRPTT